MRRCNHAGLFLFYRFFRFFGITCITLKRLRHSWFEGDFPEDVVKESAHKGGVFCFSKVRYNLTHFTGVQLDALMIIMC